MKTEQEVLEKWKPIVDFSSQYIDETPEDLKLFVSQKLQEWDETCLRWAADGKIDNNASFPKMIIPQVRRSLGSPDIEYDIEIHGRLCLVVKNGAIFKYVGKVGIPYKQNRDIYNMTGIRLDDVYVIVDGEWVELNDSDYWKWW